MLSFESILYSVINAKIGYKRKNKISFLIHALNHQLSCIPQTSPKVFPLQRVGEYGRVCYVFEMRVAGKGVRGREGGARWRI